MCLCMCLCWLLLDNTSNHSLTIKVIWLAEMVVKVNGGYSCYKRLTGLSHACMLYHHLAIVLISAVEWLPYIITTDKVVLERQCGKINTQFLTVWLGLE